MMTFWQDSQRAEKTPSRKTYYKILALMLVLAAIALCYSVSSYAWFSANIVNAGNYIGTADYHLEISVLCDQEAVEPKTADIYFFEKGKEYHITLAAAGEATTGYCIIKDLEGTHLSCTDQIKKGSSLSFTFVPLAEGRYRFVASWGEYAGELAVIKDGNEIGSLATLSDGLPDTLEEMENSDSNTKPIPEIDESNGSNTESSTDTEESGDSNTEPSTEMGESGDSNMAPSTEIEGSSDGSTESVPETEKESDISIAPVSELEGISGIDTVSETE